MPSTMSFFFVLSFRYRLHRYLPFLPDVHQNKWVHNRQIYPLAEEMGFSVPTDESGKQFALCHLCMWLLIWGALASSGYLPSQKCDYFVFPPVRKTSGLCQWFRVWCTTLCTTLHHFLAKLAKAKWYSLVHPLQQDINTWLCPTNRAILGFNYMSCPCSLVAYYWSATKVSDSLLTHGISWAVIN